MKLIRTLLVIVILVVVGFGGWSMYSYGVHIDKRPWQWSGREWGGWWTYALSLGRQVSEDVVERSKEVGKKVGEKVGKVVDDIKEIDWSAIGDKITSRTKELFGKSEEAVQRIQEHRVAKEGGEYAPKYAGEAGQQYDYGLQWLEKGIKEWRVSLVHENATERAKKYFERAVASFQEAKKLDPSLPLLDTFLEQARTYLTDSAERLKKIEELRRAMEKEDGGA